jgi:hypothetical protein
MVRKRHCNISEASLANVFALQPEPGAPIWPIGVGSPRVCPVRTHSSYATVNYPCFNLAQNLKNTKDCIRHCNFALSIINVVLPFAHHRENFGIVWRDVIQSRWIEYKISVLGMCLISRCQIHALIYQWSNPVNIDMVLHSVLYI